MIESKKVLIIDDEEYIRQSINDTLHGKNYIIEEANNGKNGLQKLTQILPDVVVVDYKMPEMDGLEFIKAAKSINHEVPVIIMTAHGNKELSLNFLKEGAFRYIEKPFDIEEFSHTVHDAISHYRLLQENKKLHNILEINDDFPEIIGDSPKMLEVFELINKVANTDLTILINGESGTGKELIAKAMHEKGNVSHGPFIRFSCAALSETLIESELFGYEKGAFTGAEKLKLGRFELAQNGTIFLDEVGELSLNTQAKLLRVLQEKEFERIGGTQTIKTNARVVTATNRNLKEMMENKTFREDLYYRLNVFPIPVPPLRERGDDIEKIAQHFLKIFSKKYNKKIENFSDYALKAIKDYHWKGNIREIENVISRAVILTTTSIIDEDALGIQLSNDKTPIANAVNKKLTENELVNLYAQEVYKRCNYSKKETAKFLDINYRTLIKRLDSSESTDTELIQDD